MEPVEYLEECYLPLGMWLQKAKTTQKQWGAQEVAEDRDPV